MRVDLERYKEYCWNNKPLTFGSQHLKSKRRKSTVDGIIIVRHDCRKESVITTFEDKRSGVDRRRGN